MENLTGKQFGPYQIVAPLGEGGMAAVYKAYQPSMERYVALKVLPRSFADNERFVGRFEREAKLLAQLQHPHILPVFDYGEAEGYTYIVMPLIQGGTLTSKMRGNPLPLPRIREVITQVGNALNYAHARGLIHRDVKPSNIMLDEEGNCLLTDFGLARMAEASMNLTSSGAIMGTPSYMSPEQGTGKKLDARTDIYSLGVVLYEMATGRVPFKAETPIAVVFKHIQDPLPLARSINPNLPEAVELVILKALAKRPEDRYQTAGEMVRALQAAIPDTSSEGKTLKSRSAAPQLSTIERQHTEALTVDVIEPSKKVSLHWSSVAIGGVILLAIVGSLFVAFGKGAIFSHQTSTPSSIATATMTVAVTQTISPTETKPAGSVVPGEKVKVRWFIGLRDVFTTSDRQVQQEIVDEFNASQDQIELSLEIFPHETARAVLESEIASGDPPDIVGPAAWIDFNDFYGQWLDLSNLILETGYDTSSFKPVLMNLYKTEEGQTSLPFLVFPAAVFYRPELFDKAGLAYPPKNYGDSYFLDGKQVVWNWDTLIEVAKRLTLDRNGRNAKEAGFDRNVIVQYGYEPQWQSGHSIVAWYGGQDFYSSGNITFNTNAITAWERFFDGIWGAQPYIASAPIRSDPELLTGNPFNSGKVAMVITPSWYLCCVSNLTNTGGKFDFGILPSFNGSVYGRVDGDTFRILKVSKHPKEAFEALTYLVGPAAIKLSKITTGMPARSRDQTEWLTSKKEEFPFVQNWDTLLDGLDYPDIPSIEGYMPNYSQVNDRITEFINLISTDGSIDIEKEILKLEDGLNVIIQNK